jgi:hypothetical protein
MDIHSNDITRPAFRLVRRHGRTLTVFVALIDRERARPVIRHRRAVLKCALLG